MNVKHMIVRIFVWTLFLTLSGTMKSAQATGVPMGDTLSANVDAVIQQEMKAQRIPGLSLAVVRNGAVIKSKGYGYANLEVRAPTRVDTIFPAGSITKQFTATAIMQLVEQGKIGLDDSITKYFPEAPAAWKPITIRHLLTHSSGIPDIFGSTEQTLYTKGIIDFHREYTEDELAHA